MERQKKLSRELSVADIITDDGIQVIINKLDQLFKKDDSQSAYLAYSEFENFKRPTSMPMKDFIAKFEVLNATIRGREMILPDGVLAYRLLHSANLNDEEMRLCRATLPELKYATMKTQLLKIFGDEAVQKIEHTEIKDEPVFFTNERRRGNRGVKSQRGRGRGREPQNLARSSNPPGPDGKISRCAICD